MLNQMGLFAIRCGGGVFEICLDAHQTRLLNPHPEPKYRGVKRGENGLYTCINECHSLQEVLGYFRGVEQAKRLIAEGIPFATLNAVA